MIDIDDGLFSAVADASQRAVWCALATVSGGQPRVRIVHPTWDREARVLWLATGPTSAKIVQMRANPYVDIQYQVAPPDFIHVLVRGTAEICTGAAERARAWATIDYDLTAFGSTGPDDPDFQPVRITPTRIELSEMFGTANRRIWRA